MHVSIPLQTVLLVHLGFSPGYFIYTSLILITQKISSLPAPNVISVNFVKLQSRPNMSLKYTRTMCGNVERSMDKEMAAIPCRE